MFEESNLSDLQKQNLIPLLHVLNANKDLTKLTDWKPISLLNVDYKIVIKTKAAIIKNVLNNILNNISHKSEKGFVKTTYIGENIRLIGDTIEISFNTNTTGIIFTYFEKAFDSLITCRHKVLIF